MDRTDQRQGADRKCGPLWRHLRPKDIAFEFGSWLSPEFKLYLIKEFQRLKDAENDRLRLEWNLQRTLAKVNYRIHTDAIKDALLPAAVTKAQVAIVYANEADLLNVALFGQTANSGGTRIPMWTATSAIRPRWSNWWCSAIWKASTPC